MMKALGLMGLMVLVVLGWAMIFALLEPLFGTTKHTKEEGE